MKELEEVAVALAIHPRRRIIVLLRDDGNWTFAEQYYYFNQYEGEVIAEGWATLRAEGIYATADIAEAEARAEMSRWTRQHA